MSLFDNEEDEEKKEELKEERIDDILNSIERDIQLPPYNTPQKNTYSRRYQQYKKEEEKSRKFNRYESFCNKSARYFNISADESIREKLLPHLNLLGWQVTPGMVMAGSLSAGLIGLFAWFILFSINTLLGNIIPLSMMAIFFIIPIVGGIYLFFYPKYAAKNKMIESSGEMILAILYMVVYLRKTPNLEGAVRFAALNLNGPIANDLKAVLWDLEIGKYNRIEASLEDYTKNWKGFNDDFLESLNLIKASMNEPNPDRREKMLEDSIETILDGTQEKMKHYAQSLKTPVMVLNAMGAMLPVLGMIMLPLVSIFMGGAITPMHLFIMFNILLPGFLYWFMQRILSSRPPTVSSKPVDTDTLPQRGKYPIKISGDIVQVPTWPIGLVVFLLIASYGLIGYLIYPTVYPVSDFDPSMTPNMFLSGDEANSFNMLLRSVSIVAGLGIGIGLTKILGNVKRKEAEDKITAIEAEFPAALFQLGNKISGGTPIELALDDAAESTKELEISGLLSKSGRNIRELGMTFEESLFHEKYGSIREYPSQMIDTVMRAILRSSEKGTQMASTAMISISEYLKNIHKTQEHLNDLLEESTTTIQLLAYMMAPVISGVAVGMSQTIIQAMYGLSEGFDDIQAGDPANAPADSPGGSDFQSIFGDLDQVIPPELLQFVVGLYLIQLLFILGTFYTKIAEGENPTVKNLFIGKILLSGILFYSMTLIIISVMFGGIVSEVT